jgi:hypothetical protein
MFTSAAVLLIAALVFPIPSPDEVKMKDGKEYKNLKLLKETPTQYFFEDLDGKKITVAKDQVEKYEKKPTIRDEVHDRVKGAKNDAKALWDIAMWAKAQGLPKDSHEVLELVIKADPEHAEARAALDYTKYEGAWVLKKDLEEKFAASRAEQMKGLGYKLEKGKLISPAEASRNAAKLVQVGKYWVTAEQKKAIEAKDLVNRDGEWITKDELAKWDAGQRKVGGVWKPILDADEAHREVKNPWILQGVYVELRSNVRYSKSVLAFKAADEAASAAAAVSGVEPDVWGPRGPLHVTLEKDEDAYRARGAQAKPDWSAMRSGDGVFYLPDMAKGSGLAVVQYHDDLYSSWWGGRAGFEAYVGRLTDITRLDEVLLDTYASYFGSFVDGKYHPASSQRFLFDATKAMPPASKLIEGFVRPRARAAADANYDLRSRQVGALVHYLAKKSPEGLQRAFQRFLVGNGDRRTLIEDALGKVDPAEIDKDFADFWKKFQATFTP